MPLSGGYFYPGVQSYNGGGSTVAASNPQFSGTVSITGALSASNYNTEGVKSAELSYPIGANNLGFQWYDDFVSFYLDAQYYPSNNGTYQSVNTQQLPYFNSGAAPDAYGIGAWNGKVAVVSGCAGITYGYNNSLGRFRTFRAHGGFWIDSLSIANSESFSASIGIGLQGAGLLRSTRNTAYLSYCDHISPNWVILSQNNAKSVDSGVPVVANHYYIFDISMTPTNNNTTNNTGSWAVRDVTANIMATGSYTAGVSQYYGLAYECGLLFASIVKNYGTSARNMYVDWWEFVGVY